MFALYHLMAIIDADVICIYMTSKFPCIQQLNSVVM